VLGEHVSAYAAVGLFGSGLHGLHLSPPELSDAPTTASVPAPFAARGPKLAELPAHPGGATLAASASGRYVSVAWRGCGTERFCVFRCGAGAGSASEQWEEVHTGVGGAVAWAAVTDTFACQQGSGSAAAAAEAAGKGKMKGSRISGMFSGGGGKDATPEAPIMAATEGVVVCKVADGEVHVVERGVGAADGAVRDVFGGALLGVLSQPLQGPKAAGMEGAALAFYTWDGRTCVGSGLSPPLWLEWDPGAAYCALAYPHCVVVYRTSPTREFEAVGQLDLAIEEGSPTAMIWGPRLMVVATHAGVHVAWVSGDAVVDTFRLAAFCASLPTPELPNACGDHLLCVQTFDLRCVGTTSVLGLYSRVACADAVPLHAGFHLGYEGYGYGAASQPPRSRPHRTARAHRVTRLAGIRGVGVGAGRFAAGACSVTGAPDDSMPVHGCKGSGLGGDTGMPTTLTCVCR